MTWCKPAVYYNMIEELIYSLDKAKFQAAVIASYEKLV